MSDRNVGGDMPSPNPSRKREGNCKALNRILPIKRLDRRGQAMVLIQTPPIDADRIGVRARAVEAFDPAMLAEQMPRPA